MKNLLSITFVVLLFAGLASCGETYTPMPDAEVEEKATELMGETAEELTKKVQEECDAKLDEMVKAKMQ